MLCNFLRLHILLACLYSQNENVLSCPSSMGQLYHFRHVLNILNSGVCIYVTIPVPTLSSHCEDPEVLFLTFSRTL